LRELEFAKIFRFHDVLRRREDNAIINIIINNNNNISDSGDEEEEQQQQQQKFSTNNNRFGCGNGTRIFASIMRMGMRATCCMLNAGNVRGGTTYNSLDEQQEWFTWKDLKVEFPFLTGLAAVELPGRVIEDTINQSRIDARLDPPVASGGYVHVCDQIEFDEERQKVIRIKGEPFDSDTLYLCTFPVNW